MSESRKPKVFIAGSRRLSRLNKTVEQRIDNILGKHMTVILGDANGADKAVQQYLHRLHYTNVVVFCMDGHCRNNVGDWPTRAIRPANPHKRDFAYYSTKDRAMTDEADYGLMLWDGKSRGTLTNILHLVRLAKPVVVYLAPDSSFHLLQNTGHLAKLLANPEVAVAHGVDGELQPLAPGTERRKSDTALLF